MDARIINRGRGPEIEGTRITVHDVWGYLKLGWHHTEIAALFRVSSDQIRIADRHRSYEYSAEVQEKLVQSRAKFELRKAEMEAADDRNHGSFLLTANMRPALQHG